MYVVSGVDGFLIWAPVVKITVVVSGLGLFVIGISTLTNCPITVTAVQLVLSTLMVDRSIEDGIVVLLLNIKKQAVAIGR